MKVKISLRGHNFLGGVIARIMIYDKCGCLVVKGVTDSNGDFVFKPPCNGIYKLVVVAPLGLEPCLYITKFLLTSKDYKLIIRFNKIDKVPLITIKLADKNYDILPIETGSITFN